MTAELRPVAVEAAISAFSAFLSRCRIDMQEKLLGWKTSALGSATYAAAEEVARNLCNVTLQIELLKHLLVPGAATKVYFKREWTPGESDGLTFEWESTAAVRTTAV
jgi:hypothetical protein